MIRSAIIGFDGQCRLTLFRQWEPYDTSVEYLTAGNQPSVAAWLMCNPSKADAELDDPTVLRVVHFSRKIGCGAAVIVNVLPWRATDPDDMLRALRLGTISNGMLDENLKAIAHVSLRAQRHVVAFGVLHRELAWHRGRALERFSQHAGQLLCLGESPAGWPLHPLARGKFAIRNDVEPRLWQHPL